MSTATLEHGANVPALVGPPDADEWRLLEVQALRLSQSSLLPSGITKGKNKDQIQADLIVIGMTARELRIPMMHALNSVHVIEGKPSLSAELMVALILRGGHMLKADELTEDKATVKFRRADDPDNKYSRFTFTIDDARTAGLLDIWWEFWRKNDEGRTVGKDTWVLPPDICTDPTQITDEMLEMAEAPEWVLRAGVGQAKWKDNWHNYPKAMLWARAVSQCARMQFADVLMGVSLTPEELGAEVDPLTGEILTAEAPQAVRDDLMKRAKALPEKQQKELKDWFNEFQCPPISKLPRTWVDTLEERIASLEDWLELEKDPNIEDAEIVDEKGAPESPQADSGPSPPSEDPESPETGQEAAESDDSEEVADAEIVDPGPGEPGEVVLASEAAEDAIVIEDGGEPLTADEKQGGKVRDEEDDIDDGMGYPG